MNITVYTIQNCSFCNQLKDYLKGKNLAFVEKDVEKNKDDLKLMLQLSDNFAGVPFTLIEKDDKTQVKLKGFTKEEFDQALEGAVPQAQAPASLSDKAPESITPPTIPNQPIKSEQTPPVSNQPPSVSQDQIDPQKNINDIMADLKPQTPTLDSQPAVSVPPSQPAEAPVQPSASLAGQPADQSVSQPAVEPADQSTVASAGADQVVPPIAQTPPATFQPTPPSTPQTTPSSPPSQPSENQPNQPNQNPSTDDNQNLPKIPNFDDPSA